MTNVEIREIADRVLAPALGGRGLDRVEVRVEPDDVHGTSLFVDAFLKPETHALGGKLASNALHALSEALLQAGESRFPYLRFLYVDEDVAQGDVHKGL